VAARGERAWDHRVSTSAAAKVGMIGRAAAEALRRRTLYPPSPRPAALWVRPR